MNTIHLDTPVENLFLVGPMMAGKLKRLGITTIDDLLHHVPFRYEDFSITSTIDKLQEGEIVTIKGTVETIKNIYTRSGRTLQEAAVSDSTGSLKVSWYNQPFLLNAIKKGTMISLSGKTKRFGNKLVMDSPVYELIKLPTTHYPLSTIHTGRLVPVYPETEGVSSKWLRSRIFTALKLVTPEITDFLPNEIIQRNALFKESDALWQIHFPQSLSHAEQARRRLSFDELFLIQLSSNLRKKARQRKKAKHILKITEYDDKLSAFIQSLPFTLTDAQIRSWSEIKGDLAKTTPMNRLLQGEVGSGKTVVSALAMYLAYLNGLNSIFMAPTDILANQHYRTLSTLLKPLGINVGLFTGKQKDHDLPITVGTHAVLQKTLTTENLGLVIIDEQQRFGVAQRATLKEKGKNPHLLTMTATPIPRTLALTLFGELDVSYIDELPKERKRVKTWVVPTEKRNSAYDWIIKQIQETKSQAYIICPFIEDSESMATVKAAKSEYEKLKNTIFPTLTVGLLHGKMKTNERNEFLEKFNEGKLDILVATPIVEVGIDVQNATIMLVEGSDRFGLTQLHQLRGRVGRGVKQGYCLLFTEAQDPESIERLKILERNFIGSHIAERDLKRRGPGDMYGLKQHGFTDSRLKIATFSDPTLVLSTKQEAETAFQKNLVKDNLPLKLALKKYTIQQVSSD